MCCSSSTKLDITPVEFINSQYLIDVKNTIAQGQIPKDCQSCVNLEQQGYSSTRTLALKDWNYTIDTVPNETLYLDLRHSNLCNFSCRSCEPSFSSEIARELEHNPQLTKYHTLTEIHLENIKSQKDIKTLLPTVQRINFTGGEPLLIKENINILEDLIRIGNTDCELLITTNGSVINNKIIDLIKQFNSVHWTVSIDAIGTTAEYVRNGTVWSVVDANIKQILTLNQSVAFNTVISMYSILDLSTLLMYFKELKLNYQTQPLEIWFSICSFPMFLNPQNINDQLKELATKQLDSSIEILSNLGNNPIRSIETLKSLQNNLKDSIINEQSFNTFRKYTEELDQIRNQSFKQTFGTDL
jgi:sulfatase maturation enzyme AslB (radical SAM superfamily)